MKEQLLYHASRGECVVYHGLRNAPEAFGAELGAEQRVVIKWCSADELFYATSIRDEPSVLIADAAMLERIEALEKAPDGMVIIAADGPSARQLGDRADIDASDVEDGTLPN